MSWKYDGALTENPALDRQHNCNVYTQDGVLIGVSHGAAIGNAGCYIRMLKESVPPNTLMVLNDPHKPHIFYDMVTDSKASFKAYSQIRTATAEFPPKGSIWQLRHEKAHVGEVYAKYYTDSIYISGDENVLLCPVHLPQTEANMRPVREKRIPFAKAAHQVLVLADVTRDIQEALDTYDVSGNIKQPQLGRTSTSSSAAGSHPMPPSRYSDAPTQGYARGKGGKGERPSHSDRKQPREQDPRGYRSSQPEKRNRNSRN
jgi:hypothetical protein